MKKKTKVVFRLTSGFEKVKMSAFERKWRWEWNCL